MPRLTAPAVAAPVAARLRAVTGGRGIAVRGGIALALALGGLTALGLRADGVSSQAALEGLLAAALIVGAGALVANFARLPARRAPAAAAEAAASPVSAAFAETREPIGGLRILVAEDNPLNQLLVHALLNGLVESLTIVSDGMEALEALRRQDFDLVLMDVNMPHLDGIAAVAAVRAGQAGRRDTPVVALTAEAAPGDAERLRAAGFDDHLAKPFRPAELLAIVARSAGQARQARRAAA